MEEKVKNNRLVQLKMIGTIKWFKMEQVVKITWFAAILTSSFINLNDGHNGYERWFACFLAKKCQKSIIWDLLKVSRKRQALKFFVAVAVAVTVYIVFVQQSNERYDLAKKCGVSYQSCSHKYLFFKG